MYPLCTDLGRHIDEDGKTQNLFVIVFPHAIYAVRNQEEREGGGDLRHPPPGDSEAWTGLD
jgi:hypothetical protein